jgi:hypothetical protein
MDWSLAVDRVGRRPGCADGDTAGAGAPVRFADAYRQKVVTYVLLREGDFWRVDDLRFENGERLSTLLK